MNWVDLLEDHLIPYSTSGPNISQGWIGLKCPFCGDNDPSEHMGIHLETGRWSCWRSVDHRGKRPHRLVEALAMSVLTMGADTRAIVAAYTTPNPDAFDAPAAVKTRPQGPLRAVGWPPHFMAITPTGLTAKFWRYLADRGFELPGGVALYYGLAASLTGKHAGRIILPVRHEGKLIGWQGRAINKAARGPRYLSSSEQVKRVLFNANKAMDGERDTLYVCEGPFDALKIDAYGNNVGIRAVATMGAVPSMDQLLQLNELKHHFKRTVLLLDNDAAGLEGGFNISDYCPGVEFGELPEGLHDMGQATPQQMRRFIHGK